MADINQSHISLRDAMQHWDDERILKAYGFAVRFNTLIRKDSEQVEKYKEEEDILSEEIIKRMGDK